MALVNRKKQQQQPLHSYLNLKSSSASSNITNARQQEFTFSGVGRGGEYSSSFLKNVILALILSPFVYFGISNTALLQKGHAPNLGNNVIDSSSSSSSSLWQIRVEDLFALGIEFDKTAATFTSSNNNSTYNSSHEKEDNTKNYPHNSLGPHTITLNINLGKDKCQVPQVWTRIVGDALVNVPLTRMTTRTAPIHTDNVHHEIWTGQFHLPLAGWYRLETTWKMTTRIKNDPSCHHRDASNLSMVGKENVQHYDFVVMGNAKEEEEESEEKKIAGGISMVQGSWIAATKIKDVSSPPSFPYIWANPIMVEKNQVMTNILKSNTNGNATTTDTTTWMLKESTVTQKYQFYDFQKLSNYELVCWIGSQSAQDIWDSFKALRRELFPHQRPFKFHYYKATSFVDPDRDWRDNTAFRKCKHILISLDEPEPEPQQQGKPLSKREYKEQVTTFIKHLLNAFDQEHTFPALIWMFTTMESPMDAVHCYEDDSERRTATNNNRTNIHPCNQVLLDLFQNNSPFPSDRVRLLDNTDLTDPIWRRRGEDVNANIADATSTAITMAIALRIYIIVGHQVKLWRDVGQVGGIHGLTRNGVTEPNFELVRYDWSQKI